MPICANCESDAVYEYLAGGMPVVFCSVHLPKFLRTRDVDALKIAVPEEAPFTPETVDVILDEPVVTATKSSKKKNSTSEEAVAIEEAVAADDPAATE